MTIKVLVVDDSHFFQNRLRELLEDHPQLRVVGIAANGCEAVEKARRLQPDVITMDFEMPVMDGVTAVREIMRERPVPILMFSSMTYEGARITLDALEAGAVDFLPKNFAEVANDSVRLKKKLHQRVLTIARPAVKVGRAEVTQTVEKKVSGIATASPLPLKPATPSASPRKPASAAPSSQGSLKGRIKLLVIGASTGGPVALNHVLTELPANFPVPILLVQHMPENFTRAFAERLNTNCKITVKEAVSGDRLQPGLAILAPGGKQMMVDAKGDVRVLPGDARMNYKPSLDITFGAAANSFGKASLGLILTGMGSDGCEGARLIKLRGGHIWSQDKDSSTIYGMPMAVARANLTDKVLNLRDIGSTLTREL